VDNNSNSNRIKINNGKLKMTPIQPFLTYPNPYANQQNQLLLQLTINGLINLINSDVRIPSFRSTSPPPNQKKSGVSFTMASSKIT
jgi:hypothetical protein